MLLLKRRLLERKESTVINPVAKTPIEVISLDSESEPEIESNSSDCSQDKDSKTEQNITESNLYLADSITPSASLDDTPHASITSSNPFKSNIEKSELSVSTWNDQLIVDDSEYSNSDSDEDDIPFTKRRIPTDTFTSQDKTSLFPSTSYKIHKLRRTPMLSQPVTISPRALKVKRVESKKKFCTIWESIIEKYSRFDENNQGDIVNLQDFSIEENRGHIKQLKRFDRSEIWNEFDMNNSVHKRQPMYENLEKLDMYEDGYESNQHKTYTDTAKNYDDPICLLTPSPEIKSKNITEKLKDKPLKYSSKSLGFDPLTLITPPKSTKRKTLRSESISPTSEISSVFSSAIASRSNSFGYTDIDTSSSSVSVDLDDPFIDINFVKSARASFFNSQNFSDFRPSASNSDIKISNCLKNSLDFDPINFLTPTKSRGQRLGQ